MTNHIFFDSCAWELRLLDQRNLPLREDAFVCQTPEDVISAIKTMVVRGAPAIGVTAAFGCVLAAHAHKNDPDWKNSLRKTLETIARSRPTAVNLAWAVKRMARRLAEKNTTPENLPELWLKDALAIQAEDLEICKKIGKTGSVLIKNGDTILTHCNAGALATAGYGTALGVIRAASGEGKKIKIIADETRPFLQGSRLTAWELAKDGIPVKVACDNACALLMSKGLVQLAVVGADRIAANGDTANKIGTFGVAIMAKYFNIPFYIAAPLSTIDITLANGGDIPIEERPEGEVLEFDGKRVAPPDVQAYNYAFDVTPADLITGIITEAGVLRKPYSQSIAEAMRKNA